jgi:hypothetical protein
LSDPFRDQGTRRWERGARSGSPRGGAPNRGCDGHDERRAGQKETAALTNRQNSRPLLIERGRVLLSAQSSSLAAATGVGVIQQRVRRARDRLRDVQAATPDGCFGDQATRPSHVRGVRGSGNCISLTHRDQKTAGRLAPRQWEKSPKVDLFGRAIREPGGSERWLFPTDGRPWLAWHRRQTQPAKAAAAIGLSPRQSLRWRGPRDVSDRRQPREMRCLCCSWRRDSRVG